MELSDTLNYLEGVLVGKLQAAQFEEDAHRLGVVIMGEKALQNLAARKSELIIHLSNLRELKGTK